MAYRTAQTTCVVHILPLRHLNPARKAQCLALRREAGRCWSEMVAAHIASREGKWLSADDLEKQFKGRYTLHSQTVQALAQKLIANVDTVRTLRQQQAQSGQAILARYPYRHTFYQTPVWKKAAIRIKEGHLLLSNGRGHPPLQLPLPAEYRRANICRVELTWRADHYKLCLTLDTGQRNPRRLRQGQVAGIDLGEINLAAYVTESGNGIVISGRQLRSVKRLRNKRHQTYTARLARCQKGSRCWKKLKRQKAKATAKMLRQQRDILHKASCQVVTFCQTEQVSHLSIGDVRNIAERVDLGRQTNQKISQWPHGQLVRYITEKARSYGAVTTQDPEDYSTRTHSVCRHVLARSPRGRQFVCPGCGSVVSRDGNASANICSRKRYGEYGHVHVKTLTYLRPVKVGRSRAVDTGQRCLGDQKPKC